MIVVKSFSGFFRRQRGCAITSWNKRDYVGVLFFTGLFLFFIIGCSEREGKSIPEKPPQPVEIKQEQKPSLSLPSVVTVPEDIRSAWAAIRIEVGSFGRAPKKTIQIAIGEEKEIAGTGLRIKSVSFLPAFQMDGHEITSRSNELENPAAQIEVYEGEDQIFKGWLFSLYPTTHAFTHPKYSLTLVGGVAVNKK